MAAGRREGSALSSLEPWTTRSQRAPLGSAASRAVRAGTGKCQGQPCEWGGEGSWEGGAAGERAFQPEEEVRLQRAGAGGGVGG